MIGLTLIVCVFFVIAVNYCDVAPVIRFPGGFSIDLGILTTTLTISGMTIDIPWLYLVFVFLLLAGMSNAVNLTDGLDGLGGRYGHDLHDRDGRRVLCVPRRQPRHILRGMRWRLHRLFVVQRLSRADLHG